jgi:hypothetical protein
MPDFLAAILVALVFVLPVAAFLRAQLRNQSASEQLFAAALGGAAAGLAIVLIVWPQAPSVETALITLPYVVGATLIGLVLGGVLLCARLFGAWLGSRR